MEMKEKKDNTEGYPIYPASEDIYSKLKEEKDVNPEDNSKLKESSRNDIIGTSQGNDLDIPGSELDDRQEFIGSEDEENNYYSLGSDDHNDLEDQGE